MAYFRFGEGSDVYMYNHVGGGIECCMCSIAQDGEEFPRFDTATKAIAHLHLHVKNGDSFPVDNNDWEALHKLMDNDLKRYENEKDNTDS